MSSARHSLPQPSCPQPCCSYPASLIEHAGNHNGTSWYLTGPSRAVHKATLLDTSPEMGNNKKCFKLCIPHPMFHLLRQERTCPINAGCPISCIASRKLQKNPNWEPSKVYLYINTLDLVYSKYTCHNTFPRSFLMSCPQLSWYYLLKKTLKNLSLLRSSHTPLL